VSLPKERSVERDVEAFCGWDFLVRLVEAADSLFMKALISALFETGGRISEVLALRKWNIDLSLHPEVVVVRQMPLVKRFEKVGEVRKWKCVGHCSKRWDEKPSPDEFRVHNIKEYTGWVTRRVVDYRTFPIRRDEPLTSYLIEWWKKAEKDEQLLFPIGRSLAYIRVREVGKRLNMPVPFSNIHSSQIYDHWFRAERACQLAFDYGFTRDDLREFFGWKERKSIHDMAERYASLGWIGLAKKMGVNLIL